MRDAGPYKVQSHSDGSVRIYPGWSEWDGLPGWLRSTPEEHDAAGGPGLFSRMALADQLQAWLNAVPPKPKGDG